MIHEQPLEHELFRERECAARNMGRVALSHDSIMRHYNEACLDGSLDDELRQLANNAGLDYNDGIAWLLNVSQRIYEAGL